MSYQHRKTRQVRIGKTLVGGGAPITVQTMTKTDTRDAEATISLLLHIIVRSFLTL
jgi:(E)-4-hydroxy-3-methylbut-2-enyl-diphosphate synthase